VGAGTLLRTTCVDFATSRRADDPKDRGRTPRAGARRPATGDRRPAIAGILRTCAAFTPEESCDTGGAEVGVPGTWIDAELDRQVQTLVRLGYPEILSVAAGTLGSWVDDLRAAVRAALGQDPGTATPATASLVLVVQDPPAEALVPLLRLAGGRAEGIVDRNHGAAGLAPYRPLPELGVPATPVYAILHVERGEELRGLSPEGALPDIRARGRTPLTIHEGIALVTHAPQSLEKNHCFTLAGSRRGDRRVPALWISGRAPKLGWCWAGNPHDWLGTASLQSRIAAR